MKYSMQEKLQKSLMFEAHLRVNLPEAVRAEAVSVLSVLIATVMGDTEPVEHDGGSDE